MKLTKIIAVTLLLCLSLSLCACFAPSGDTTPPDSTTSEDVYPDNGDNTNNSGTTTPSAPSDEDPTDDAAYLKMEEIAAASRFREGIAMVGKKGDADNFYFIDKTGKILFSHPHTKKTLSLQKLCEAFSGFSNGKAIDSATGALWDTDGTAVQPEDVGVTKFLEIKLGEYIIAEKVTSDYISTKTELGVLNYALEWVVPLSESNRAAYEEDPYFFLEESERPPIYAPAPIIPEIENLIKQGTTWREKTPVAMQNPTTMDVYVSVIDESGEFLFPPVKVDLRPYSFWYIELDLNDEHLVVSIMNNLYAATDAQPIYSTSYDMQGNKLGEINTAEFFDGYVTMQIHEGTLVFNTTSGATYYTTDFQKLF